MCVEKIKREFVDSVESTMQHKITEFTDAENTQKGCGHGMTVSQCIAYKLLCKAV